MDRADVTPDDLAECLAVLENAGEAMTAAMIAAKLGKGGCRETQRRQVRSIIKVLRDKGCRIAATLQGGYFLAEEDDVWLAYLRDRQIGAKTVLGAAHKRERMLTTARGQGLLFAQRMMTGLG